MRVAPALLAILLTAALAAARCGDDPGDAGAVAAARAAVEGTCDCGGATSHTTYVRCALGVLRQRVESRQLPPRCKSTAHRCASRSTCGRPGSVACCLGTGPDARCSTRRDATTCTTHGGTVSACPSCCDACGGCTTTTSTSTSTTVPTTTTLPPCGTAGTPECNGRCAAGATCVDVGNATCACVSNLCGAYPRCDGACPAGQTCASVGNTICACVTNNCGGGAYPQCDGTCPTGSTCFNEGLGCDCVQDACLGGFCACLPPEWAIGNCPPGHQRSSCPTLGISFCVDGTCASSTDCPTGDSCQDVTICIGGP